MPLRKSFACPAGFIAFCLLLVWPSLLDAQQPADDGEIQEFIYNRIGIDNQNWKISQSPVTGYVYMANSAGLVEYNGISHRVFKMPFGQGVRSVYVNSEGKIFTGSFEDFGVWLEDGKGGLYYNSMSGMTDVGKNDEIWNILELNNTIYFQSFTAIYRADHKGITKIPGPSIMLFMFRAGNRFIVQLLDRGLFWFDGTGFDFIEGSEFVKSFKIHAVIQRRFDEYWIGTANDGVYIFDGVTFRKHKGEISEFLERETCNAGIAFSDTLIAFGTILRGVVFCDEKGTLLKSFDLSNGLNNNTVLSLHRGIDGGLWAGLDEGVNYINLNSPVTMYANFTGNLGTIYTALKDGHRLYLGTNHGLFVADIVGSSGDYRFNNLRLMPGTQGQVWQLSKVEGQILCGHNDGTFEVGDGEAKLISGVTGGWSLKPYGDLLLEGTYTGLVSFIKNSSGRWSYRKRISGYFEPTRSIEVDYLGYVWAIHPHKGLYRLELNEGADSVVNILKFSSISADTSARISMSRINNQMVFMTGSSIYAFDYEAKSFYLLSSLTSGLGEYARSTQIIPYRKNSYWFILGDRIALFEVSRDLETGKELEFCHKYADLPGREQQIIPLDDNSILVPTRQAFSLFNTGRLLSARESSSVKISRMIFSGRNESVTVVPADSTDIKVPNRKNNLTVWFANPAQFDQADIEYLYRIPELGPDWHRTTLDNFTFLNLGFGNYTLQVKTSTGDVINEAEFTVRRPNYLSITAICLYVILLAGLVLTGVRVFRLELERHRKLIEYEVGKNRLESELDYKSYELMLTMRYLIRKTDILRELHDKLDSLKAYSSKFPVKYIREMESIIDHGLDSQTEEWQNVMKNLKLSQEGFFRKLKEKYPALTPNDLRLCSYLRMNFSTKEIANLINISSRAVEIGRYRLRRKMKLGHDVNLNEFLMHEAELL